MLFKGFPDDCESLKVLRNGALDMSSSVRWATEWEENAKGLILKASLLSAFNSILVSICHHTCFGAL
ncbi:PREDICTED: uncharacterized protein LOC101312809 [Fragaria vesca subsp. vesca]